MTVCKNWYTRVARILLLQSAASLAAVAAAAPSLAAERVISRQNRASYTEFIDDLELILPLALKPIVQHRLPANASKATALGTSSFRIAYQDYDPITQRSQLQFLTADIQVASEFCAPEEKLVQLRAAAPEDLLDHAMRLSIDPRRTAVFSGFIYQLEDHRHRDRNFIFGAVDSFRQRCYSISLAVYGVGSMRPPVLREILHFLTTGFTRSLTNLSVQGGRP